MSVIDFRSRTARWQPVIERLGSRGTPTGARQPRSRAIRLELARTIELRKRTPANPDDWSEPALKAGEPTPTGAWTERGCQVVAKLNPGWSNWVVRRLPGRTPTSCLP